MVTEDYYASGDMYEYLPYREYVSIMTLEEFVHRPTWERCRGGD